MCSLRPLPAVLLPARVVAVGLWCVIALLFAGVIIDLSQLLQGQVALRTTVDFEVYREGAHRLLHRDGLYSGPFPTSETSLWFTYPPAGAAFFLPLLIFPFPLSRFLWLIFSLLCAVLIAHRCIKLLRLGAVQVWLLPAMVLAMLLTSPLISTFRFGQINLVLAAVILYDLTGRRGRGFFTGVAAAVKLTPLVFLPGLILARRFADAARMAAGFVFATIAVWLWEPTFSHRYWFELIRDTNRVGPVDFASNTSLRGVLARVGFTDAVWVLCCVLAVLLVWQAYLSFAGTAYERLAFVLIWSQAALLLSPVSWIHHWVWWVPLALLLWAAGYRKLSVFALCIGLQPFTQLAVGIDSWWSGLASALYVIGAVVIVVSLIRTSPAMPTR